MKEKLKKSLKLEKRTIRKLAVRSGLRGGNSTGGATIVTAHPGCEPKVTKGPDCFFVTELCLSELLC